MLLFCPKEKSPESRVAVTPESAQALRSLGFSVCVESGAGLAAGHNDEAYRSSGAEVVSDAATVYPQADVVLRVRSPEPESISALKPACLHVSFFDPFSRTDLLEAFAKSNVRAVSMEMMPRTTLAQKMDALSSQANLAGYYAVVRAAERLNRILPMMMTPAGTIAPAKVFVIGVGVAGLQAIATAKRLGARVEAFDTRPVVEEQVKSLGARFVKIDIGESGQTEQGYARELTPEQLELQRAGMAKVCSQSDIVITTAKLFGRKSPVLLTREMLAGMRRGSVVVDLAAESGGNVEGVQLNAEFETDEGVRVIGYGTLEACVSTHASQVYASNLQALLEHVWDAELKTLKLDTADPILKGCLLTDGAAIIHECFRKES
ncbi:MAG: Re/Si-specific NAD(P)(+) transhydrogenase subunit alpha [Opitutales bacterium]|nr:Re/Si-specific NAD(P)(+) transhydrogenase subunit alpha [Opitutales bacterium]